VDDISDFTKRVVEQFGQSQETFRTLHDGKFFLDLSDRVVEDYVKAAFYASMIPDEGRHPTVALLTYRRDSGPEIHFPFCPPRVPTPREIAKLAHAVNPGGHLCFLSEGGKLLLGGIHITFLDEMRHLGYADLNAANPLKVIIRGPGNIAASNGGIALIYKEGVITEERLLRHGDVIKGLAQAVEQELTGQTQGTIESLDDIFSDIIKAIARLGHGGMLIVAKERDLGQFKAPWPAEAPVLRNLLVRYWDSTRVVLTAAGGLGNLRDEAVQQAVSPQSLALGTNTAMLENCVASIGSLAGMDGAIVMDYACNVVAFNTIIDKSVKGTSEGRLVEWCGRDLTDEDVVGDRGSRHQSALLYAKRVPNCFVFVISQDGGVTAFHNRGDGSVLCEQHLRVLN